MTDSNEKADLEQLIASAGWLRIVERARVEWKEGYPMKIKLAITEAREKGESVEAAVLKVDYANDQIAALVSYPKDRLAQIVRAKDVHNVLSRGGYETQAPR